ncbi:hypothetical protein K438DRAFT_1757750 [Mycena galopus ATCC 62051]|nr:hypothetical protein K438DRAFT_1757750 [Mycena galopus ATCC 62051]
MQSIKHIIRSVRTYHIQNAAQRRSGLGGWNPPWELPDICRFTRIQANCQISPVQNENAQAYETIVDRTTLLKEPANSVTGTSKRICSLRALAPHVHESPVTTLEEFDDLFRNTMTEFYPINSNLAPFVEAIISVLFEVANLELLDLIFARDMKIPDCYNMDRSTFRCNA